MQNKIYFLLVFMILFSGFYFLKEAKDLDSGVQEKGAQEKADTLASYAVPTTLKTWGNETYCLTLENATLRDMCILDAASESMNRSLCSEIEYENMKYRCRARVEANPSFCARIDVLEEKDWCYHMMAFKINDKSMCGEIFTQSLRDKCWYSYVMDKKPDPVVCFDLINETLRDRCIYRHVGLKTSTGKSLISPALCHLIVDPQMEVDCNQTYLFNVSASQAS